LDIENEQERRPVPRSVWQADTVLGRLRSSGGQMGAIEHMSAPNFEVSLRRS
jgi:hypothetical protein